MDPRKKRYKKVAIVTIVVLCVLFGLSRLKIQSVKDFQKESTGQNTNIISQKSESNTENFQASTLEKNEEKDNVTSEVDSKNQKTKTSSKEENLVDKKKKNVVSKGKDNNQKKATSSENKKKTQEKKEEKKKSDSSSKKKPTSSHNKPVSEEVKPSSSASPTMASEQQEVAASSNAENAQEPSKETASPTKTPDSGISCTIEIQCTNLLDHMDKVKQNYKAYVPSDGMILKETKVSVKPGSSVYDVLYQVCKEKNIQIDASYTPAYASYYVKAIGYLYEKAAGDMSGWMYQVNGSTLNKASSEITVKSGDKIEWIYTYNGKL